MEWTQQGQAILETAKKAHTDALQEMGSLDYARAFAKLREALLLRRQVLPRDHPLVMATLDAIASMHNLAGDMAGQRSALLELRTLQLQHYGFLHPEVEQTTQRLHDVLCALGEMDDANILAGEVWRARTTTPAERTNADLDRLLERLTLTRDQTVRSGIDNVLLPAKQRVEPLPPRTSRFLDPDWTPWKEVERVKAERAAAIASGATTRRSSLGGGGGVTMRNRTPLLRSAAATPKPSSPVVSDPAVVAAKGCDGVFPPAALVTLGPAAG